MMQALLEMSEIYWELDQSHQTFLNSIIEQLSPSDIESLTKNGASGLASAVSEMINAVASDPSVKGSIDRIFSLGADASNTTLKKFAFDRESIINTLSSGFADAGITEDTIIKIVPHAEIDPDAMIQEIQSKISDPEVLSRIQGLSMDEQIKVYYSLTDVGEMSIADFEKWLQ